MYFQVGDQGPGFHVTCKSALFFFYLTMSVVDKSGFITEFLKCFSTLGFYLRASRQLMI